MANIQRQYVGARYVPKLANPQEWSSANAYEALVMVTHDNTSYISGIPVPAGVDITNTDYWLPMGSRDVYIQTLQDELALLKSEVNNGRVYWRPLVNAQLITIADDSMAKALTPSSGGNSPLGWPATKVYTQITSTGLAWSGGNTFATQFSAIVNQRDFDKSAPTNVVICHGLNDDTFDSTIINAFAQLVDSELNGPHRLYIIHTGYKSDVATGFHNPNPNSTSYYWFGFPAALGAFGGAKNSLGQWDMTTANSIMRAITDHLYFDVQNQKCHLYVSEIGGSQFTNLIELEWIDLYTLYVGLAIGETEYNELISLNTPVTITFPCKTDLPTPFTGYNTTKIMMEVSGNLDTDGSLISMETEAALALGNQTILLTFSLEYPKEGHLQLVKIRFPPQADYLHIKR